MSRPFAYIIITVTVACGAFIAGAITAAVRGWGSPLVSVSVRNNTSGELQSVSVNYSTCNAKNALTHLRLPPGKAHTFRFPVCGEGGFQVQAVLHDGSTVASAEDYVESGYSSSAFVETTRIRSETHTYGL
jgi:hypothetical protein